MRAAEAVRDGKASAMVSAGNTGATMASALLRMGRIKGVNRPAVATPIPVPGALPTVLLDAGANAEVQAEWLVQFAQMGSVYARHRFGIAPPRVGLLSIGEEPGKGDTLRKETFELLGRAPGINFVGNVEGRDVMTADIDVVVTDGFTGNVVLEVRSRAAVQGDREGRCSSAFGADPARCKPHADAAGPGAGCRCTSSWTPTPTAGRSCSGWTGCASSPHGSSGLDGGVERHQRGSRAEVDAGWSRRTAPLCSSPGSPTVATRQWRRSSAMHGRLPRLPCRPARPPPGPLERDAMFEIV